MPCYHPIDAYQSNLLKSNGKREIVFSSYRARDHQKIKLPCGQCVGCRLERSRQWAIRCMHEASLHAQNIFITLTYSDQALPADGSLQLRDWQLFMKKLRKKYGSKIRFFHCGEYGEKLGRPHYHAIIFNFDFADKKPWKKTKQGHLTYRSQSLEELWTHGYSEIGSVSFESAAYVARYIMKKINGDQADDHYAKIDPATGQIFNLKPEYITMSRRPGIGKNWFEKFSSDVYPSDEIILKGKKYRPPKYYDRQYEILDPQAFDEIKSKREDNAKKYIDDQTPERLNVKEQVILARISRLKRNLK
ncbi:replication initiator protein [Blackfly microvirus SF02]|uniref:Replication initiator protein n=1 Tax=Blackfly microvirus SF02 TaxID=2576452 RepID=A0A4V1F5H8_9VIRU|nr:replication initiator protein [Blackfly microvirus SF02]